MIDEPSTAPTADHPTRAALLRWGPFVGVLLLLAVHVAPLWRDLRAWPGTFDTGYVWFIIEVDRVSIAEYGQLPLWNPYYCGGAPQLASPQTGSLSPLTLLPVLFGTPVGYRLGYTLGLVAALFCLRAYARTLGLADLSATVAGAGYAMCGAFAQHLGGGHWGWISFAFYPLILRSLHLVMEGRRDHIVWGALPLTLMVFHWPVYPMAYALVTIGLYALFLGLQNGPRDWRRLRRALLAAVAMIALGLAMGAVRLLPVAEHIFAHPRKVKDRDYTWPWELFETYGWRHTERAFGHHQYVFPEFGNYIGIIGLALVFCGAYLVVRRRRVLWPVVAGTVAFLLFQMGNLVPLPWWLLKKLPIYENLRVPSRFTIIAGLFMCVLIGVVIDQWAAPALQKWRTVGRRSRVVAVTVLVLATAFLIDAVSFNRLQFLQTFGTPPPTEARAAQFHQAPGNRGRMYAYPRANLGSLNCFEETPLAISPALAANLPADEYLRERDAGTVRRVHWSPNQIELDVDVHRPATVLVNQNWGPGWRASGGQIANVDGLLAATVPVGKTRVVFRYLPRSALIGGVISLTLALAAAAFVFVFWRGRRRPRV
ncbi:MAG TPA: hypothetical protein VGL59_19995 [Polyangia bacterium]